MEITTSEEGESLFEAYHSIFSKLISTDYIYEELANHCGADFEYTRHASKIIQPNTIYCKKTKTSAHYIYCNPEGNKEDPYDFYQIPMSEGNCFAYALYLASKANHTNTPLPALLETRDLMDSNITTFWKVADDPAIKQRAYQTFVFNDIVIIQWITGLIVKTNTLPDLESEWEQLSEDERKYYGIPQAMTFSDYWANWTRYSSNIQYTYLMTLDQITNWDANVEEDEYYRRHPEKNSGIEHSDTIDFANYVVPDSSVGGKRRRLKTKTTKSNTSIVVRTYKKRN